MPRGESPSGFTKTSKDGCFDRTHPDLVYLVLEGERLVDLDPG
jgi:hypothetical protein